jgi:hypothetical protein
VRGRYCWEADWGGAADKSERQRDKRDRERSDLQWWDGDAGDTLGCEYLPEG